MKHISTLIGGACALLASLAIVGPCSQAQGAELPAYFNNLLVGNETSTMISVANAPGKDEITGEQTFVFKAALRHMERAVRIHRELRIRDLDHDTAPDRLECLHRGVMLVDGASRVVFANAAARVLLNSAGGLALEAGCLRSTDGSDALLQGLIVSCSTRPTRETVPAEEFRFAPARAAHCA